MLKLYLAQINPIVGDIIQNHRLIIRHIEKATASGADIVIFPELALTGYPPEDLLLKTAFISENLKYIEKISKEVGDIIAIVGFAGSTPGSIYNSAAIMSGTKIVSVYNKQHLPNYSVFDEERYFRKGDINYIYKIFISLLRLSFRIYLILRRSAKYGSLCELWGRLCPRGFHHFLMGRSDAGCIICLRLFESIPQPQTACLSVVYG